MQDHTEHRLHIIVANGLRLVVRAYCARLPDADRPVLQFAATATGVEPPAGPAADLLLSDDIAIAHAVAPPQDVVTFATDTLIAASRPEMRFGTAGFLNRLCSGKVRVVLAVPGAPETSGMIERFLALCEAQTAGAGRTLRQRVRPITGLQAVSWGPRQAMELLEGEADVVLGSRAVLRSLSAVADLVAPPAPLAVNIACAGAVLATDPRRRGMARQLVDGLATPSGQALLARYGFGPASGASAVV